MHSLQACLCKCITDSAFRIYALHGEDTTKRGGWRRALILNSHGIYIVDHGKSWKNHGIVFLNLWEPC